MLRLFVVLLFALVGAAVAYAILVCTAAKKEIAVAPRKEMFLCDKHGPIPAGSTITLMEGEMDQVVNGKVFRGPVRSCPICFQDAVTKAKGDA